MTNLTGFVNIVKPTGMTSSDVVLKVKKILKTKKVGHLGTLDPAASGVLPVAVGKATKFFDYFLNKDKEYVAVVKFGIETDTLDSFGNITNKDNKKVEEVELKGVIKEFVGEIMQTPPKYSAIKINGKKACDLARENIDYEIQSKRINVYSIELIKSFGDNYYMFKVHCSAGTYIRTLFSDIAKKLNTLAFVPVIIRTKSGRFNLQNAITLDEFEKNNKILTIEEVFSDITTINVSGEIARKLINGVKINPNCLNLNNNEEELLISQNTSLIGFFKLKNESLQQLVYLYEGE